jgi:hypothetical protein
MLPATLEDTLPYLGVVRLPQSYVDVAVQLLKMDYFLHAYDLEGVASALRSPVIPQEPDYDWCNHPKEVTVARQGYAQMLDAYHRQLGLLRAWQDPRRPTKEQIQAHYAPKIRRAIVNLLAAGDWVDSPEQTYPPDSDQCEALLRLNTRMRGHSLGRNSHLTFSSNPGKVRRSGTHQQNLRSQTP